VELVMTLQKAAPWTRRAIPVISSVAALFLASMPMIPTPQATPDAHWLVLAQWWLPSLLLLTISFVTYPGRFRLALFIVSAVVFFAVLLAHPVCVLITKQEQPNFETTVSLRERAIRGEPFRELDSNWYQCKSFLARALFF
jgi:hypothetical protein